MVAHQLMAMAGEQGERHAKHTSKPLGTITIRGTEGMAVQFAQCCRPIPGDPILGFINKDKGLVIHTHDCPAIRKFRVEPERWLDVEWDPDGKRLFKVNLKLVVANQRGMLAKIAAGIADAGSNIDNVSMEDPDDSAYSGMHFTVQVRDRLHLADLMRRLRKIPDVVRINRVKGAGNEQRVQ
jgi:guanosine-3',5'-bis(diphosphate) 3'-pyrophosphohydrolase